MHRILALLAIVLSLPSGARAAARIPAAKVVDSLVRDLGADPYDVRERATATLRKIGEPARGALEQAARSDDPEIRVRARDLLEDIRSGIRPHWSPEVILLMRHFDNRQEHERYQGFQQIVAAIGHEAVPFLLERMAEGTDNEKNWAFQMVQQMKDDRAWRQVLELVRNPANDQQARLLAWARGQSGQTIESIERLAREQIKKIERNQAVEAGIQDILAKLDAGKAKEAADAAAQLAKTAPDDARVLYLQAEALVKLDRDKEALALRQRALDLNPDKEEPHFLAGDLLASLGQRRLAVREWEKILAIQPNDGICDVNAWISLSSAYAASGLFEQAAQYLSKAQERFARMKAEDNAAVVGGTIESLEMEVSRLRGKAARYATPENAAVTDPVPASEVQASIAVEVPEGDVEDLKKAVGRTAATVQVAVEPPDLDLFEDTSATLRYDKAKKQLLILLGDAPACEPFPFEAKDKEFRVAVNAGDRTQILKVDADTGEATPHAKFVKDYRLTLKPGVKAGALGGVELRINGTEFKWELATGKGVVLDRLPDRLDLTIEGTAPSGARQTLRLALPAPEPTLGP